MMIEPAVRTASRTKKSRAFFLRLGENVSLHFALPDQDITSLNAPLRFATDDYPL